MKNKNRNKLIDEIRHDSVNRLALFRQLSVHQQIGAIFLLSKHIQLKLVNELSDQEIVSIIEHLDPNDATDTIQLLPSFRQPKIINLLNDSLKAQVSTLLNFDPDTAAGLMNVNYILVSSSETVASAALSSKKHESRTGKTPVILIVDNGTLKGHFPSHQLVFAKPNESAGKYVKKINTISHKSSPKSVIDHFRSHPHSKVVVIGDDRQVLGIIFVDDILHLLQAHETTSLYNFAGISEEESIHDNFHRKVKFRYKWLLLNLATSFLAAFTVGLFDDVISKFVLLAVYMPIVAGMGGNAATQTLAVMVRGLSQEKLKFGTIIQALKNEVLSGITNGLINGVVVVAVVYYLNRDLLVGIVLALAMVINLFIAGTFGTIVPIIMKKFGKDPASSATIFITTATDVFGFLAFLGLAKFILH